MDNGILLFYLPQLQSYDPHLLGEQFVLLVIAKELLLFDTLLLY